MHPFTLGPSASVYPWLAGFVCTAILWALADRARPRFSILLMGASLVAWLALTHGIRQELAYLAAAAVLVAMAATLVDDPEVARAVQIGILVAACANAFAALIQYFGASNAFDPWIAAAPLGHAYGNLRQPNQFASLCSIGIAVLMWGRPAVPRRAALALAALIAVASAASVSRTAVIQGLALLTLAGLYPGPERAGRISLCAVAGGAYLLGALLLPEVLHAATGAVPPRTLLGRIDGGETCSSRLVLWSNVLQLVSLRPWVGWGWGELDYAHYMNLYPGARFCDILDNAHGLPLHLAVEAGVPVAVLVCAGVGLWAWRRRPWSDGAPDRQLAWAVLAVVLLHSLLEYPLWYAPFQLVTGISLGWLTLSSGTVPVRRMEMWRRSTAVVFLMLAAYTAWDYLRLSQIYLPAEQRRSQWREDPISHAKRSWLFRDQVLFAELTLEPLTRQNATWQHARALDMLHYSPEPRIIERVIESSLMLDREREALEHLARFRAAFPAEHEAWARALGPQRSGAQD